MKVDLDPRFVRAYMRRWRETMNLNTAMPDALRAGMLAQRQFMFGILANTAVGWLMALRHTSPAPKDKAALAQFIAELESFRGWAEAGLLSGPHPVESRKA